MDELDQQESCLSRAVGESLQRKRWRMSLHTNVLSLVGENLLVMLHIIRIMYLFTLQIQCNNSVIVCTGSRSGNSADPDFIDCPMSEIYCDQLTMQCSCKFAWHSDII